MTKKILNYVGILFLLSTLSGCGGVTAMYKISAAIPNENYQTVGWETVKINVPDLNIYVRSLNDFCLGSGFETFPLLGIETFEKAKDPYFEQGSAYYSKYDPQKGWVAKWPAGTLPAYFYIEIVFDPKENGFSFDPKSVVLTTGGKNVFVSAFIPSENFTNSIGLNSLYLIPYSGEKLKPEQAESQTFELKLNEKRGFAIKFDVPPPEPGDDFEIKIEGLKHEGSSVNLPLIQYHGSKEIKEVHY